MMTCITYVSPQCVLLSLFFLLFFWWVFYRRDSFIRFFCLSIVPFFIFCPLRHDVHYSFLWPADTIDRRGLRPHGKMREKMKMKTQVSLFSLQLLNDKRAPPHHHQSISPLFFSFILFHLLVFVDVANFPSLDWIINESPVQPFVSRSNWIIKWMSFVSFSLILLLLLLFISYI